MEGYSSGLSDSSQQSYTTAQQACLLDENGPTPHSILHTQMTVSGVGLGLSSTTEGSVLHL